MSPRQIARSNISSSSVSSTPPSPAGASLSPWRLKTDTSPRLPHGRPRQLAPWACDASSTIRRSCSSARASISVIFAGRPQRCTTTIAFVRSVTRFAMSSGHGPRRSVSLSQNTGTSPNQSIGRTDAQNVAVGTSTSSPGSRPSEKKAAMRPAVPLLWARAKRRPAMAA